MQFITQNSAAVSKWSKTDCDKNRTSPHRTYRFLSNKIRPGITLSSDATQYAASPAVLESSNYMYFVIL
jgi:hypothetical protein